MIVEVINLKSLKNKNLIYKEVANFLYKKKYITNKNTFLKEIYERENLGSVKIYEDFYLPHIISKNILKSSILRIDGQDKMYLFILLNLFEEEKYKEKISSIIKILLNRNDLGNFYSLSSDLFKEKIKFI